MLLRALAESPQLRLRVLTGADALERPVTGVFTTDLLDPRRYLTGGEIILTGLMWRRGPEDSAVFVAALAAAGVAALAAGDAVLGSVPPDLVEACRRHRLPLLEVPVDVSFAAITEQVLRARLREEGPDPALARFRLLAAEVSTAGREPADELDRLFAMADAELGIVGWVLSATGRLVAGAHPALAVALRQELAAACLAAPRLLATVSCGGRPFSLVADAARPGQAGVPGSPGQRLAAWFAVFDGEHTGWDAGRQAAAAELAGLAARCRARHEDGQQARRRAADGLLGLIMAWPPGPAGPGGQEGAAAEIAAVARACGLCPDDPHVAVALRPPAARPDMAGPVETAGPRQQARAVLEDLLPGSVAGVCGDDVVAITADGSAVRSQITSLAAGLGHVPGLDLAAGVSRAAAPSPAPGPMAGWAAGLGRAVAEACQAGRIAALLGGGVRIVDGAELGSVELLLAMVPAEARRAYHARLLAPLQDYDHEHGTELVATLAVFLRCSGSWTKAAEAMFVHVNSLRYRVRRIEELTGASLRSLPDQAAFLIALRLAGSAAEDQPAHPPGGGIVQAG